MGVESDYGHNWTDTHAQGLLEIVCTGVTDSSIDRQDDGDVSESSVNEEELIELPEFQGKETVADVRINPELSATQLAEVSQLLEDFKDVLTDVPGETNLIEHEIKLVSDQPVRTKQYPLPFSMTETIKDETEKMLEMCIIEPSQSPYISPVVLVKKSDQSIRF